MQHSQVCDSDGERSCLPDTCAVDALRVVWRRDKRRIHCQQITFRGRSLMNASLCLCTLVAEDKRKLHHVKLHTAECTFVTFDVIKLIM